MVGSHLILTNEASRSGNTPPLLFGPIAAEGSPPVFGGKTDAQHGGDNVHFLDVIWVSLSCCILWLEHRLENGHIFYCDSTPENKKQLNSIVPMSAFLINTK